MAQDPHLPASPASQTPCLPTRSTGSCRAGIRRSILILAAAMVLCSASAIACAAEVLTLKPTDAPINEGGLRATWSQFPQGWLYEAWGDLGGYVQLAQDDALQLTVVATRPPVQGDWPNMAVHRDGYLQIVAPPRIVNQQAAYRFTLDLPEGVHRITVSFILDKHAVEQGATTSTQNDIGPKSVKRESAGGELWNATIDPWIARLEIRGKRTSPRLADHSQWVADAQAQEQRVLADAEQRIDRNRKGQATLTLLDAQGKPIANQPMRVKLSRHAFLFGANSFMLFNFATPEENEKYEKRFAELFNYTTTYFYWRDYEREQGHPTYDKTDRILAWAQSNGITVKGHPLLADFSSSIPQWHEGLPTPEMQQQRVSQIVQRFRGQIDLWDVVNEPAHGTGIGIDLPYRAARKANPDAVLVLNDHSQLANGYPPYRQLLKRALSDGVPIDAIGIQGHNPLAYRFPLHWVERYLDQYAEFGLPIHITEFIVPSANHAVQGSHLQGNWDEALQADYAEKFYTLCFAHPAVSAITWWDLCDRGAWLSNSGLLRDDLSPKPAYDRLHNLIHQKWTTDLTLTTDQQGRLSFTGFFGDYQASLPTHDDAVPPQTFALNRQSPNEWVWRLDSPPTFANNADNPESPLATEQTERRQP